MVSTEPGLPQHETMLGMLLEARRRGLDHTEYSLSAGELLLQIDARDRDVLGGPCASCHDAWPCKTATGIFGGLVPLP
jgi:hypothetical protein